MYVYVYVYVYVRKGITRTGELLMWADDIDDDDDDVDDRRDVDKILSKKFKPEQANRSFQLQRSLSVTAMRNMFFNDHVF